MTPRARPGPSTFSRWCRSFAPPLSSALADPPKGRGDEPGRRRGRGGGPAGRHPGPPAGCHRPGPVLRRVPGRPLPRCAAGLGDRALGPLPAGADRGGPGDHARGGRLLRGGRPDRGQPRLSTGPPGMLGPVDSALGVVVAVVASLLVAWLLASTLVNSSSLSLNAAIGRSRIIRSLDNVLPAPPSVFSRVQSFLSAEGFPPVFAQLAPASAGPVSLPGDAQLQEAVAHAGGVDGQDHRRRVRADPGGIGVRRRPGPRGDQRPCGGRHPPPDGGGRERPPADHGAVFDPSFDLAVMRVSGVDEPAADPRSRQVDPGVAGRGARLSGRRTVHGASRPGSWPSSRPRVGTSTARD